MYNNKRKGKISRTTKFNLGGFQYENSKGTFKRKQQQDSRESLCKAHRDNEIL